MIYSGNLIKALTPQPGKRPAAKAPEIVRRAQTLSVEDEARIMRRYAMGEPIPRIAEDYHMSCSGIRYHLDRVRIRERKKRKSGQ